MRLNKGMPIVNLLPPLAAVVFMGIMIAESGYTLDSRETHFSAPE